MRPALVDRRAAGGWVRHAGRRRGASVDRRRRAAGRVGAHAGAALDQARATAGRGAPAQARWSRVTRGRADLDLGCRRRCRCGAGRAAARISSIWAAPARTPARLARISRLLRSARALSATRKASGSSVSLLEHFGHRRLAALDQRPQAGKRAVQDQLPLQVEQPQDARVARRGQDVGDHASRVLCLRMSKTRSARPMPPRSARSRAYWSVSRLAKASSPAPPPKPSGMALSPV